MLPRSDAGDFVKLSHEEIVKYVVACLPQKRRQSAVGAARLNRSDRNSKLNRASDNQKF